MRFREYRAEDKPALEAMYRAQGFAYEFPDIDDSRLWITRMVLVDDEDKPLQAVLGRLTSEAFFIFDPKVASPVTQMRRFVSLQEAACESGRRAGVDSVHCWLPPEVKETFGPQLERLGWLEYEWATFARSL